MSTFQKEKTQGNTEETGEDEPACAVEMNLVPVLHDDDEGDGDRNQDGERGGNGDRDAEGEERDGDERLPKAECGSNQRGEEDDG